MLTISCGAASVSVWWPPAPPVEAVALSLNLPRRAIPWKRPKPLRNGNRASFIEGEKLHTFYVECKMRARRYRGKTEPVSGPVEFRLRCGFPPPKGEKLLELSPVLAISNECGDFDNLAKGVADSLSGVVWKDDRQVVAHHFLKFYATKPLVIIEVIELDFFRAGFAEGGDSGR